MKKTVAALCAAMFALSACSGGEDDQPPQAEPQQTEQGDRAKENIKASLLEQGDELAGTAVTDEQAGCVADGMVDEVGVEKLQEYKLLDEKLAIREDVGAVKMGQGDAEALAAVFVDCVDIEKVFEERFSSGAAAEQLSEEQQQCLKDAVDSEIIEKALADTFQGKAADPTGDLQADIMSCIAGGITGGDSGGGGGGGGGDGMELPPGEE